MDRNKRTEIRCGCCGKSRFLSISEAEEDGWRLDTKYGIICEPCQPKFGIPRNPLQGGAKRVTLFETSDGGVGTKIEF